MTLNEGASDAAGQHDGAGEMGGRLSLANQLTLIRLGAGVPGMVALYLPF